MRTGGCHCGAVRYAAKVAEPLAGSRCNCSICAMKGAVMAYVPLADLQVTAGEDSLACYSFNTGVAKHYFCATCGVHCFHQTRANPELYAINVVTLDGVDVYADFPELRVNDGIRHMKDNDGITRTAGWLRFEPSPKE